MLPPVKNWIFGPKMAIFDQKNAFLCHFGPNISISVGWLVGGCGARAASRKTPIYFMIIAHCHFMPLVEFDSDSFQLTNLHHLISTASYV